MVVAVKLGGQRAVDLHRDELHQLFGQIHQVVIVRVCLVELEHGELGVVLGGDALVAEVAIDLVDAIQAADDQALEVKLRSDAQEERDVQGIVVRGEGPGHRAASDGLHHGRLDFEIAAFIEEAANGSKHLRALDEDCSHIGVDEEIEIPLAIA